MPISRALILSGGGGRGACQAGVWAWLEEQGWRPELVCGSSVGAIDGASIASGMPADPMGMRSLLRFEPEHAARLCEAGYRDARGPLGGR